MLLLVLVFTGALGAGYREYAIEVEFEEHARRVAKDHSLDFVGQVGNLKKHYLLRERSRVRQQVRLAEHPLVRWSEEQVKRKRFKRQQLYHSDPLYVDQWHLNNVLSGGVDVNAEAAWRAGYTGKGVRLAIVDDGLQWVHPDLMFRYNASTSHNFNNGKPDDPAPDPDAEDFHGTACAGVAGASADNNVCGSGVAFGVELSGIRLISGPASDADEAAALGFKYQENHIYSNSWGPEDDGARLEGPKRLAEMALLEGVRNGRQGKGNIFVWAGGNGGGAAHDNCNYDSYANSPFTIATGAINEFGKKSYYSEECAAIIAVAPSSGSGGARGISTVDLVGEAGYSLDECDDTFGGTSSACPLLAGVVALMLEARPELSWKDVQQVLIESSRVVDAEDTDWTRNGAGRLVSHKYGYGLIDAHAAVQLARTLTLSDGIVATHEPPVVQVGQPIPQYDPAAPAEVSSSLEITEAPYTVEHVQIHLTATHPRATDLSVVLTSPSGTKSVLAELRGFSVEVQFSVNGEAEEAVAAEFGVIPTAAVRAPMVVAEPLLACAPLTGDVAGKLVLVERGVCPFTEKAEAVERAGGLGLVVYNNLPEAPSIMGGTSSVTIPCVMISNALGLGLVAAPPGMASIKGKRVKDSARLAYQDWGFTSVRHWGEPANGKWTVTIRDEFAEEGDEGGPSQGTFVSWRLLLYHDSVEHVTTAAPTTPAPTSNASHVPTEAPPTNEVAFTLLIVMAIVCLVLLLGVGGMLLYHRYKTRNNVLVLDEEHDGAQDEFFDSDDDDDLDL